MTASGRHDRSWRRDDPLRWRAGVPPCIARVHAATTAGSPRGGESRVKARWPLPSRLARLRGRQSCIALKTVRPATFLQNSGLVEPARAR